MISNKKIETEVIIKQAVDLLASIFVEVITANMEKQKKENLSKIIK